MIRKICCIVAVFFLFLQLCFSKKYTDGLNNYIGEAVAECIGTTRTDTLNDLFLDSKNELKADGVSVSEIKKLSLEENFLLWSALKEYDYSIGEIYTVVMFPKNSNKTFLIFVRIKGRRAIDWKGYSISAWESLKMLKNFIVEEFF